MALPTIRLDYWNGSAWVEAKTHKGNSAVVECTITKILNNPSMASVVLANPSKDWTSTTASTSKGNLTEVFEGTPFMHCILRDNETGLILFRGRVYSVIDEYDVSKYADSLQLLLHDGLKELNDYPIKTTPPSLTQIALNTYDKRSELIELISTKLNARISFSDTTKFEPSHHAFTTAEKKRAGRLSDGNYYSDISTSTTNALQLIHDISQADPHDGDTTSKHYGFDYYVDPAITSCATNFSPVTNLPTFNYFERGTRPSADTSAIAVPATYGITVRYPIPPAWAAISDDLKSRHVKGMLPDSRFIDDEEAMYTSAQVTFEEKGANELDASGLGESEQQLERDVEFELLYVTIPSGHFTHASNSTGKAIWESKRLFYRADKPTDVDTTSGGNGADQSNTAANPHLIYKAGSSNPCAIIHYASGSASGTAADYVILSNIYDASETYEGITFDAFPTDSSSVRFFTRASQSSSATTAPYFDLVPSTGRVAKKFDIKRPLSLDFYEIEQSSESIRKHIASSLNRRTVDKIVKGELRINRYPYVKIVSPAANAAISSNVITFSTQGGSAAFTAADDSTKTNDCRTFGVKKGMVVAEMYNNTVTRYSYISAVNATTVTYGASATDTSDGTALDVSKPIAIFIPAEAGHMIRAKHDKNDREMDMVIENIIYRLDAGLLSCEILGTGIEENGVGIPGQMSKGVKSSVSAGVDKGRTTNLPPNQQTWTLTDGNLTPVSNTKLKLVANGSHADGQTLAGNGGQYVTVVTSDGQKYAVAKRDDTSGYAYVDIGGTGATLGQPHVLYLRKSGYVNFLDSTMRGATDLKATAATAQDTTTTIYNDIASSDDVLIGWAEADKIRYRYDSEAQPSALTSPITDQLNGAIDNSASTTTVAVDDGSKFVVGDIIINTTVDAPEEDNSEKMLVTAKSGNNLTVIRAVNNSTIANHSDDNGIAVIERINQNSKALATLNLNGAGSFGDRGSIDIKELSIGSFPGYVGSTTDFIFGDTSSENSVRISDSGVTFQLPAAKSDALNMAGNLDTSTTSVVVDDASVFSTNDIIRIKLADGTNGTEQIKITGISSNTLTVTRGHNSTTAQSYNDNAIVTGHDGHNENDTIPNTYLKFNHNVNAILQDGNVTDTAVGSSQTYLLRQPMVGNSTMYQSSEYNSGDMPGRGRNLVFHDARSENTQITADGSSSGAQTLGVSSRLYVNNMAVQAPRFYGSTWAAGKSGSEDHPTYTFSTALTSGMYHEDVMSMSFSVEATEVLQLTSGVTSGTKGIYVSGAAYKDSGSGDWLNWSDDRIKTNAASLTNSMAVIQQLNPISYKYTSDWQNANTSVDNKTQVGYLASEFGQVFPNQVHTTTTSVVKFEDGTLKINKTIDIPENSTKLVADLKLIDTGVIVPHLVAAVKELKAEIDDIKNQLNG